MQIRSDLREDPSSGRVTPPMITPPCSERVSFFNTRPKILRRQSSLSSVSSFTSDEQDDDQPAPEEVTEAEWDDKHDSVLLAALEEFVEMSQRIGTPFTGLPPSQLTHAVSRAVMAREGDEWVHTLKQTRSRLLFLGERSAPLLLYHATDAGIVRSERVTERHVYGL